MKHSLVVLLLVSALLSCTYAANNYMWGEPGPNDILLASDTVSKTFILGFSVNTKYIFKQTGNTYAPTITAVRVTDLMKKNGATAQLSSGGPGSKGVTIKFKSQRGHSIKNQVYVYGR